MFHALEFSLAVLETLVPLEAKLRAKRKSLADEVSRAAESVALNVAEGRARAGLDRADFFGCAGRLRRPRPLRVRWTFGPGTLRLRGERAFGASR